MSDEQQSEHNEAQAAQTGAKQAGSHPAGATRTDGATSTAAAADAASEAPLNGGEHVESGSYTGTHEHGVAYDGAFTDSEIPEDDIAPGETEADRAGFEGSYTESDTAE